MAPSRSSRSSPNHARRFRHQCHVSFDPDGRVTTANGDPVVGAFVFVDGGARPAAQTDAQGRYRVGGLTLGRHAVEVRRTGYATGAQTVLLTSTAGATADVSLARAAALAGVTVIGTRGDLAETRERVARVSGGASLVESAEIRASRQANLKDVLKFTPGVYIQPRFGAADESQISVRGSGLRNNYHARGINLLVNGMPYRNADGFTDFESLELLNTEAIEVYKGANALRYGGSTLGGAIALDTKTGYTAAPLGALDNRFTLGLQPASERMHNRQFANDRGRTGPSRATSRTTRPPRRCTPRTRCADLPPGDAARRPALRPRRRRAAHGRTAAPIGADELRQRGRLRRPRGAGRVAVRSRGARAAARARLGALGLRRRAEERDREPQRAAVPERAVHGADVPQRPAHAARGHRGGARVRGAGRAVRPWRRGRPPDPAWRVHARSLHLRPRCAVRRPRHPGRAAALRHGGGPLRAPVGLRAERTPRRTGATVFVAGQNLADRRYAQSVQVDNAAGKFYEPADRRSFYAGVRLGR